MNTTVKRTGSLILGFVMLWALAGLLSLWFSDTTSAGPNMPPLNVYETNLDTDGFIRVHEQGTVSVSGTVNVGNSPAVQDVYLTNDTMPISGTVSVENGGCKLIERTIVPSLETEQELEFDIEKYSRVRFSCVVYGSGTVDFEWFTDARVRGSFSLGGAEAGDSTSVLLPEVAGTTLVINLKDPDEETVYVHVYGSN